MLLQEIPLPWGRQVREPSRRLQTGSFERPTDMVQQAILPDIFLKPEHDDASTVLFITQSPDSEVGDVMRFS